MYINVKIFTILVISLASNTLTNHLLRDQLSLVLYFLKSQCISTHRIQVPIKYIQQWRRKMFYGEGRVLTDDLLQSGEIIPQENYTFLGLSPPRESLLSCVQIKVNEQFWTLLIVLSLTQLIGIELSHEVPIYTALINTCERIFCQNASEQIS